jgi:ribosome biogenesis GTPase A
MSKNPIQWFPGHMAKTRRIMKECLPSVDIVLELLDARIPYSSKNPEIREIVGEKPKLTVLTKSSLANDKISRAWQKYYEERGERTVIIDSQTGSGLDALERAIREILADKIQKYRDKGMEGRRLKAMIVGIPNVGKSSLINKLAKGVKAKVENRPGVTLTKQWVSTNIGIDLLDMPGVLWPKFEDETVGENLAMTGAIRDAILDTEELAMTMCDRLRTSAKDELYARYKLTADEADVLDAYDLFCLIGKKRGFLASGGEINQTRTAEMLLEEFRSSKIGKISLEIPR